MYLMIDPSRTVPAQSGSSRRLSRSRTKPARLRARKDATADQPASTKNSGIAAMRRNSKAMEALAEIAGLLR